MVCYIQVFDEITKITYAVANKIFNQDCFLLHNPKYHVLMSDDSFGRYLKKWKSGM